MREVLENLLKNTINRGLYQVIISNARDKEQASKVKIRPVMLKNHLMFQETIYRGPMVFHKNYDSEEIIRRIEKYMSQDFKQCEIEHTNSRAIVLVSKKGKITIKEKKSVRPADAAKGQETISLSHNRAKNYILKEGIPVPFLIDLGLQDTAGRILHSRYDKYKQINRFLEFIQDILPALPDNRELHIIDFGCGKSYLTFAVYYYLHEIMGLDISMTGLDLKEDVIAHCNELSQKYGYRKLRFLKGDIAQYQGVEETDMVMTLHACDTATDYALDKAVKWGAKVILSVPCCQHEVNRQISCETLQPLLQYGIVKERMSALITDAIRADLLRSQGYDTDLLEFIEMEHTPKNILIRAIKKDKPNADKQREESEKVSEITKFLRIEPLLQRLLEMEEH